MQQLIRNYHSKVATDIKLKKKVLSTTPRRDVYKTQTIVQYVLVDTMVANNQ